MFMNILKPIFDTSFPPFIYAATNTFPFQPPSTSPLPFVRVFVWNDPLVVAACGKLFQFAAEACDIDAVKPSIAVLSASQIQPSTKKTPMFLPSRRSPYALR
jgi:hypothetical protein